MNVMSVARNAPSKKLKSFDNIRHTNLPDGRVVTFTEDLGFMAMFYFVCTYQARKTIFGGVVFDCVKKVEVEDSKEYAEKIFELAIQQ